MSPPNVLVGGLGFSQFLDSRQKHSGMTPKGQEGNIMEQINFDVQIRKNTGSASSRQVRRSNLIPGIVYGGNSKPTVIQADRKAYDRIYRQHAGESLIYHLNLVDEGKKISDF